MDISITDAELVLMRLLWKENPLNSRQITERLASSKDWHRKTVNTLLGRLEKKSVLSARKHEDGIKYFTPIVEKAEYSRTATSQFVDRLFGGEIAPLVASFAKKRPLSSEQIAELQSLLKEFSDDD